MQWVRRVHKLVRKVVPASRLAGQWLRWRLSWLISPRSERLRPPLWAVGLVPATAHIIARYDAPPERVVLPLVYGAQPLPAKLLAMGKETAPRPLALTRYCDVAMVGRRIFVSRPEGTVLPYSYHASRDEEVLAAGVGRKLSPPPFARPPERTARPVFAPDVHHDEFGHVFLETVPALALLKDAPPDAIVATSATLNRSLLTMGQALGVAPERWRRVRQPLLCDEIYLPDLPIQLFRHIHPLGREALERLGSLGHSYALSERPERVFLSRSRINRRLLLNEAEIEAIFVRHGFTIVHPETLPIEGQIALLQGARLVAGPAGTAMHLMTFAPPEAKLLILSSPLWFTSIDVHLNPVEGRLGYVFGTAAERDGHLYDAPWSVDAAEVETAIRRHFDL